MPIRKTTSVYRQVDDGVWYRCAKKEWTQCCDCGLVHLEYWRQRKVKGKLVIEFRTVRDNRATAAVRRQHKFVLDDHG